MQDHTRSTPESILVFWGALPPHADNGASFLMQHDPENLEQACVILGAFLSQYARVSHKEHARIILGDCMGQVTKKDYARLRDIIEKQAKALIFIGCTISYELGVWRGSPEQEE